MQAWISERIIHVGAEAEVSLGTYLGQPAVEKSAAHASGDTLNWMLA